MHADTPIEAGATASGATVGNENWLAGDHYALQLLERVFAGKYSAREGVPVLRGRVGGNADRAGAASVAR
jgi:hypothetical protein